MTSDDDQFDDGLEEFDDAVADDFGGDDAQAEESFADEDWDSYDEQGDAQQDDAAPQKARKKSNTFNLVIIGLGVLAGAALLVFKLGGGSAPAPTPITAPETIAEAPAPAPTGTPVAPAEIPVAPTEQGFLTSPENMEALEQDIAATYSNTEVVGVVEGAPEEVADAATPPMPAPMEQAETESPLSSMESPPGLDNLTATQPAETTATTSAPVTASPAATEEAPPIRMPSATDVLLKQPAETSPAAAPETIKTPAPEQSAEMIAKLDQVLTRLDQLESDVSALKQQNKASTESLETLEEKISERPTSSPAAPRPTEDANRPPQPQILGSGPSETKPAAKPVSNPEKRVTQWVLKGAQPGRAMVSQPGDSEMRNVEVGDTLSGIGRITAISYQDGRWVVQGTQGKIVQ